MNAAFRMEYAEIFDVSTLRLDVLHGWFVKNRGKSSRIWDHVKA
jgi:hypothetical protein